MKKALLAIGVIILVLAGLVVLRGEQIFLAVNASRVEKTDPGALESLLEPAMIIRTPAGEGPFPVVFQFHGCAGARLKFQEMWAAIAVRNGYMAVIVDSLRPRGYSRAEALKLVCRGRALLGQERAGDVAAAINLVLGQGNADPRRVILTGWSHGAWAVMDYMTMDMVDTLPAAFDHYAGARPDIRGSVLFYPYCGIGALTRVRPWHHKPVVLALIAGADTIVDHTRCLDLFDGLEKNGIAVNQVVYPDTEHVFDDPFLGENLQHWHHPENLRDAISKYEAFLNTLK